MLFDLEDYAGTSRLGCMDPAAINYDPRANRKCTACCRYPINKPYQEAIKEDKTPLDPDCCLKLNKNNPEGVIINGVQWTAWEVRVDASGVSRCIRSSYTKSLYE